ncbi:hypothetical protein ABZ338_29810 [Streptomyces albidoflavus]|uniref:hypothetical protein n=1 Tax=Streptomyces albidoflavus TaxID=1886 RepID=UPI0005265BE8|nr:hypothetical protein [Streptomyces albidoflavus]
MSRCYQPHEEWPRHSKAWWRESLNLARAAGWHLKSFTGHAWGRIMCDPALDESCSFLVLSTGNGGEDAAHDARKRIERCPHIAAATSHQILVRAAMLLEQADGLMDAADACLTAEDRACEAEELWSCASSAAAEAEQLLEQAVRADEQASALLAEAYEALPLGSELGCPPKAGQVELLVGLDP